MDPRAMGRIPHGTRAGGLLRLLLAAGLGSLLLSPGVSHADADFFLYRAGSTLFLSLAAPTSPSSTFTPSPGLTFWFGNQWEEIGTWGQAYAPAEIVFVQSAPDLHVWLGLKNSDDIGTAVDLAAEIWVKGVGSDPVLVAQGLTRCIRGLVRDPSKLKEVIVPFTSTPYEFSNGTEGVALRVFSRIGTTPQNERCTGPSAGHVSALGVRLYHGGVNQASNFGLVIIIP